VLLWKGRKLGLSSDGKNHDLWRYLENEWFCSADEDDMLDLLHHQITSDLEKMVQGFHIENVDLTDKLLELPEVDGTTYGTSQGWHWICKLGQDVIERGQVLLMIYHLGHDNKHWVALVVNGESKQLVYGNSMDHKIPKEILIAYQEWFLRHSSAFTLEQLPIPKQVDLFMWPKHL